MKTRLAAAIVCLSALTAYGQNRYWAWTPKGDHHKASCSVWTPPQNDGSKFGASGVYVTHKGQTGVLTVAHLVRGGRNVHNLTVRWSDGTKSSGVRHTVDKFGFDLCWVFVSHPTLKPIPLASTGPVKDQYVELVTRGGPGESIRHWWGRFLKSNTYVRSRSEEYTTFVISGDSGGAILNRSKELVGINHSGSGTAAGFLMDRNGHRWPVYRNSESTPFKDIQAFMDRVVSLNGTSVTSIPTLKRTAPFR